MRSGLWAIGGVLALAAMGCEKKPTVETPPKPAEVKDAGAPVAANPPEAEEILIGEVGSMSGAEAAFGQSTHNGIQLAVDEANAAGGVKGKKLKVRTYDDQSKPEEAASATTRLITQDKVKVILGEVASSN